MFLTIIVAETDQHRSVSKKGDHWPNSFAPLDLDTAMHCIYHILSIEMPSQNGKDGEMSAKASGAGNVHRSSFMIYNSHSVVPRIDPGEW
jgi:hypothetical protein